MPSRCSRSTTAAARIVPYDSPNKNFGDAQRSLSVTQPRMNESNALASSSMPKNVLGVPLPVIWL